MNRKISSENLQHMKKAIIVGATSGIGKEVTNLLLQKGWRIGIAGRREDRLKELQSTAAPGQVEFQVLDVTQPGSPESLHHLIDKLEGMDLFLLCSGIGKQNPELDPEIEMDTARTNTEGFIRMVTAAYRYFRSRQEGHLAVISSIAGTKGLGMAPAYSATKRFQNTYIDALDQLSHLEKCPIHFTDIRPGFVDTDLLKGSKKYPMLMPAPTVARHIVRALERKKRVAVIDWKYRILVFFWRMIPRSIWEILPVRN